MSADKRVMEFFPSAYDRTKAEQVAARLRDGLERDGYGWWVLEIKNGATFAGVIALQDVPFEAAFAPALEIGWRLRQDQWGNGYATEAAQAALGFAFEKMRRHEVVAMTAAINLRSQHVMRRLGMTYDPRDDFDNPKIDAGHRLQPHVLYRIQHSARLHQANKLRPCVVVEDSDLFDDAYPNVLLVPLADDLAYVIPALTVLIEPTKENGCAKRCYAVAHAVVTAPKTRVHHATRSRVTDAQLQHIRELIAESLGLR